MRVLFAIFVLSVGALLWAAVAIARHIRRHPPAAVAREPETLEAEASDHEELLIPNSRQPGH